MTSAWGCGERGGHRAFVLPLSGRYRDPTFAHEEVAEPARYATIPVINGLTDLHHPCQIPPPTPDHSGKFGRCEGVKLAWVGDGNNVASSWLQGAAKMGMHLALACPEGPLASGAHPQAPGRPRRMAAASKSWRTHSRPSKAHVIYTDVWVSMGQEAERRWRLEVFQSYQVNQKLLAAAKPTTLVMHCLPAHAAKRSPPRSSMAPNRSSSTMRKTACTRKRPCCTFYCTEGNSH